MEEDYRDIQIFLRDRILDKRSVLPTSPNTQMILFMVTQVSQVMKGKLTGLGCFPELHPTE